MPRGERPAVPGVLSGDDIEATARAIAAAQGPSGALPWFPGGHVDPWDHVESAMALSAAGLLTEAQGAYEWSRHTQRADGSWPLKVQQGRVADAGADTNFCAYLAVGVWHHVLICGGNSFARRMWPSVRRAIDFVLRLQTERGEIGWARDARGDIAWDALLSGCSSIHHSLRCALALADHLDDPQPEWELALGRLAHVLRHHPEAFLPKQRYSMDWYYPVLGGALRGEPARRRLRERWGDFVVDGLGVRCVQDHPWVTGAETCELVLSLDAVGEHTRALDLFAAMQHRRVVLDRTGVRGRQALAAGAHHLDRRRGDTGGRRAVPDHSGQRDLPGATASVRPRGGRRPVRVPFLRHRRAELTADAPEHPQRAGHRRFPEVATF